MRIMLALPLAPVAAGLLLLLGGCGGAPPGQTAAGGGAAAPAAIQPDQLSWATYTEPSETAFTVQAPQGWRVNAGVVRASAAVATPWLTAASPDAATLLYIGDPDIPVLFITPAYGQAPEGAQVPGAIMPYTVLETRTAAQFAQMYGASNLPTQCASQQLNGAQARPDLVQLAEAQPSNQGLQIDAGQAGFSCVVNGKPYEADVYAITTQYQSGLWSAQVFGLRTPLGQGAAAEKVLFQMLASKHPTPQWSAQMAQAAQQAGALARQQTVDSWNAFGAQMSTEEQQLAATMQSGHEAYMSSMSQAADARSAAFVQQQYNKGVANQNFLLMVRNQHLVQGPSGLVAVPN
jgi:hypothetical protein